MHGEHVYDSYFYILAMLFRVMCNEAFLALEHNRRDETSQGFRMFCVRNDHIKNR